MASKQRQLVLNVFFQRWGHHLAAWRHHSSVGSGRPDLDWWIRSAKLAEAGKFHTFFLADFIGQSGEVTPDTGRRGISYQFEPFTMLSAIAAHTKNIGLVATVNTNYEHPYHVARKFTSLDHISGGRAGWNIVSSYQPHTAKNFGLLEARGRDERYGRAAEFVELSKRLWDSWDDNAFDHPDRKAGQFYDPASSHALDYHGKYFSSEGLLDFARPIQGSPVLVQAGNSEEGREFCARIAEMSYCSAQSLDVAQAFYKNVKSRMAKYGRAEDQLIISPGLSVVVAESDQEAQDRFGELQQLVDVSNVEFGGFDLSGYDVDGPLPDLPYKSGENGVGRFQQQLDLARRENLSIRQLVLRFRVARGHLQAIGSVKTVADTIEKWFVERGADGFNVVPPYLPQGFEDFVRLVVPELQRRGIFHKDYGGGTFREELGLDTPRNPLSSASTSLNAAVEVTDHSRVA